MLSPCVIYVLRLAAQSWSQAKKTGVGLCEAQSPTQPVSRLAPPRVLATTWRQLALGFLAAEVPHDSA